MSIELYYAPTSPYVRKVMICAHELGLSDQLMLHASAAHPVERDARIKAFNPLAKIPAARTEDGLLLYDSRVICEYLDWQNGGALFPREGTRRWDALRLQALADGLLDAALLARYETIARPPARQWPAWHEAQMGKIADALDALLAECGAFPHDLDIGLITAGCALGYLDFRFPDYDWREGRQALAEWFTIVSERPSFRATVPHA